MDANMTVYLRDRNGYLAPISYQWDAADAKGLAQVSLELLVKQGLHSAKLPAGFEAVLPQGTGVTNVTLKPEQKLAIVELSKEFANYDPAEERQMVEAITWTLTSLPDVENVQLWMDSHKLNEMPKKRHAIGYPVEPPVRNQCGEIQFGQLFALDAGDSLFLKLQRRGQVLLRAGHPSCRAV
ncbi:GerMN domain-containing protein [Paenibacillus thiaminolyticus]|uniref:GerMN domain-containing protein n=1 Tax=Paenibacillus thiaminolyticus TaxID=49283 RepID=UPI0023506515|nr:GerMN domain-containing protein [Paenibacillus thiaminolyticus]WCR29754.1 GerMN domain-containing protein [Paenibacillus thiaminolyticus]